MIELPYDNNSATDKMLPVIIKSIREDRINKDDDYTLFVCGARGTGKSMFGLHCSDIYMGDKASVDYIGLNPSDFARALKKATTSEKPRFCNNDEANISKRDFQSKYNKDLLDTYYSIRGLNIFHIWNNPSLDIIDKKVVEDIVNGVVYIFTKDKNKPRLYYYFPKISILKILEKEESLSLRILKKYSQKYAYYRGWFRDYNGILKKPYLEKKNNRMEEKVNDFFDKYAKEDDKEFLKIKVIADLTGVSVNTIKRKIEDLKNENKIDDSFIKVSSLGFKTYSQKILPLISEKLAETKKNLEIGRGCAYRKQNENSVMA